jgi:peroxiredoxin
MKQSKGPGRTTYRILPLKTNLPLNNMKLFKNLAFAALMGVQTVSAGTFGASATPAFACPAKLPSVEVMQGFPDVENINVAEYCSGKNVIIVGLPGAFTPTWSSQQVPGYLENEKALKEAGIEEVIVYCVNDPAVMQAWGEDQGIKGSFVNFVADPAATLTKALDMEMTHPGPPSVGIIGRCKRFALHAVDGEIKTVAVSEGPDDPAGDSDPSASLAEGMLEAIKKE